MSYVYILDFNIIVVHLFVVYLKLLPKSGQTKTLQDQVTMQYNFSVEQLSKRIYVFLIMRPNFLDCHSTKELCCIVSTAFRNL